MKVAIIIPIYKTELSAMEMMSLIQVYKVLKDHPIIIIKPEALDLSAIQKQFPALQEKSFDNSFFTGITGYNRLMLSAEFYHCFLDYDYILIYQLDAYVFRDELLEWCAKGYDYIGAPWIEKPVYRLPLIATYMQWRHNRLLKHGKNSAQSLYNKVGNGGFSLRKVKSYYHTTTNDSGTISFFISQENNHFYNEDVFWATQVPDFKYPDVEEALRFSFDKYPKYCYKLTGNKLPFGCHAWYKRKMRKFWKYVINF
jgi:hypothetical protein